MDGCIISNKSKYVINDVSGHEEEALEPKLVLIWMFVLLSVIGIIGNSCSILLLSRQKHKKKKILSDTYRVYIIALAVADNGMLFFTGILRYAVVSWVYENGRPSLVYEVYLCRWHRLLMHTCHNAAVWLLVVMAVDRFVAVCFPFRYREEKHNSAKAVKVTAILYFMCFALATPFLAVGPLYDIHEEQRKIPKDNENSTHLNSNTSENTMKSSSNRWLSKESADVTSVVPSSTESWINSLEVTTPASRKPISTSVPTAYHSRSERIISGCSLTASMSEESAYVINIIFHVLLAFLIPYFVLILLNLAIIRSLRRPNNLTSPNGLRHRLHRRITIMMLVVCGTFIILWLPQALLLLTSPDAHSHTCHENEILYSLAALSGLANSALNFVLYCMTVKKFRIEVNKTIRRLCCLTSFKRTLSEFPTTATNGEYYNSRKQGSMYNSKTERSPLSNNQNRSSTSRSTDYKETNLCCPIPKNTVMKETNLLYVTPEQGISFL